MLKLPQIDGYLSEKDKNIMSEIITAAQMYEAALGEQHHIQLRHNALTNLLVSNIGFVCACMVQHDRLCDKIKDAEEYADVLQESLGQADDRIKALEQQLASKKKGSKS